MIYEPWIVAMKDDGSTEELSIMETFRRAHEIKFLAGELPTQDIAILRLLLAIMYCVYLRRGPDGVHSEMRNRDDALNRWNTLWKKGSFDADTIESYLKSYEDRFYLFHPQRPFYQVNFGDRKVTSYGTPKLRGDLSESGNKPRLFASSSGKGKDCIGYSESARWLLHINAFDDTSGKPSVRGEDMPSPGAGWLGKLGLIMAQGRNLFDTLMMNFVLADDKGNPFPDGKAIWEMDTVRSEERVVILTPKSPIELLTLQSRRLSLQADRINKTVTGFMLLGGDIISKENALIEQMTLWTLNADKDWTPKRHDPSRFIWRDYPAMISKGEERREPGVVIWASWLESKGYLPYNSITFRTIGTIYADKDFYANNIVDDALSINAGLLSSIDDVWNMRITDALVKTEECVEHLGNLFLDIYVIRTGKKKKDITNKDRNLIKQTTKEDAYYRLDQPFRLWLSSIDSERDDLEKKMGSWIELMKGIIINAGKRLLAESGERAFVGTDMKENATSKFNYFTYSVNKTIRGEK